MHVLIALRVCNLVPLTNIIIATPPTNEWRGGVVGGDGSAIHSAHNTWTSQQLPVEMANEGLRMSEPGSPEAIGFLSKGCCETYLDHPGNIA